MKSIKQPIVIVGAGFGGTTLALKLKRLNPSLPILVIDSEEKFIFKPLMYEILSQEINMWEAAPEFLNMFSNQGITFLKKSLNKIKLTDNILQFNDDLHISYQYLVLCTGSITNTFSVKGVDKYCSFFNNLDDINKLKIILGELSNNYSHSKLFIVGAGPSGIEIACKINDIYQDKFKINIIESATEILNKNKIFNREEAEKAIKKRRINLFLNSTVQEISEKKISILNNDELINMDQDLVIWTAGVKPNIPYIEETVAKIQGRILVNNNFQLENFKNVFAIGDIAIIKGMEQLPQTAQVAMQQGDHLAKNLNLLTEQQDYLPFNFQDNGEMISLGIGEASISALGFTLSGKLAFEARRLIYASKLPVLGKSLKSTASWLFQKKSILSKFINKTP